MSTRIDPTALPAFGAYSQARAILASPGGAMALPPLRFELTGAADFALLNRMAERACRQCK